MMKSFPNDCRSLWRDTQPTDQQPQFEYISSVVRLSIKRDHKSGPAISALELGAQCNNSIKGAIKDQLSLMQVCELWLCIVKW